MHAESERSEGLFLAVNCAGVPDTLLESEFFGHVEGAFSGATHSRPGLFQEADGGTLLLDEIGEMSGELQAKLLRVLEEGRVRPVGSEQPRPVDVRVLAATNRDPEADDGALENVVERAVTYCEGGTLEPRHLPERIRSARSRPDDAALPGPLEETLLQGDMLPPLRELGDRYIRYVLERVDGNKRRAAALLGISRRTLYRRLDGNAS